MDLREGREDPREGIFEEPAMTGLETLERKHALEMLAELLEADGVNVTGLVIRDYKVNGTRVRRMMELEAAGLISRGHEGGRCNELSIRLTEKGRAVASHAEEIRRLMG